jgi:cell wall-associated protease
MKHVLLALTVLTSSPPAHSGGLEPVVASPKVLERFFNLRDAKGESRMIRDLKPAGGSEQPGIWATLDPVKNSVEGTSTEEAHKKFKDSKRAPPVIVAVIDSGVDIRHEELAGKIWENEVELKGQPGVDDDGDGYVDDFHGWNFLGAPDGAQVTASTLEVTRIYAKLRERAATGSLSAAEKTVFEQVKAEFDTGVEENTENLTRARKMKSALELLKSRGLREETLPALDALEPGDPAAREAATIARALFGGGWNSDSVNAAISGFETALQYHYNPDFDSSRIVGDHPEKLDERGYGNNDVVGPNPTHGTHVAGIIAANRENLLGIRGHAQNVRIMPIRVVPDGDERD